MQTVYSILLIYLHDMLFLCVFSVVLPTSPPASLSQLSDSGQTLSEDSGVDTGEVGGGSKDSSPQPQKSKGAENMAKPVRRRKFSVLDLI